MQQYYNFFRRFIKVVPFVGIFFVLANAGDTLRRKGYLFGALEVALDICPIVCLIKASIETYTGDLIPEKSAPSAPALEATA